MFIRGLLIGKRPSQDEAMYGKTALIFSRFIGVYCRQTPKAQQSAAEHQKPHNKQDKRSLSSCSTA